MDNLKVMKKLYDKMGNDYLRSTALTAAGLLGLRKDVIRMDTNQMCNIRCIMCNSKPQMKCFPYMKFEYFQKIIDQFAPTARMCYLSCAFEPLITPNFADYVKYAKDKGIPHVSFCTNGLLLKEDVICKLIECQTDEIIFSFNGFCKNDYNRIMDGSNFEVVCGNLRRLAELKKQAHSVKPHVRLNTIMLKSNFQHFDDMYQLIKDYDIDLIQFRELMLYEDQNDPSKVNKELLEGQTPEEYHNMMKIIRDYTKRLKAIGKEIILPASFLNHYNPALSMESAEEFHPLTADGTDSDKQNENAQAWAINKQKNAQKHRCSVPFFSYWIDYLGNVRVCGYDDRGHIGNALSDTPKLLAKNRKAFQKLALSGQCEHHQCIINVDTSTII